MSMRLYLAMTAGEYRAAAALPDAVAWMACHFSCYGAGLCNLPGSLPEGAMIIVNDRTPIHRHDPSLITEQLTQLQEALRPACILLDLQRPDLPEATEIARSVTAALPCPVGVSEYYAAELSCPVFLQPPPVHLCLEEYLASWKGREIWLEAAPDTAVITLTSEGAQIEAAQQESLAPPYFTDPSLHCHYRISLKENSAEFTLQRDMEQLQQLLKEAEKFGVTQAIGLYQQLG